MAKKLTKEEKIKKAKTKRKIKTTTKVILTICGAIIAIPMLYLLYVGAVFFVGPKLDYDPQKPTGAGYSLPLRIVNVDDNKEYVVAYYLDDYWTVIDDTELIKRHKTKFIVYKSEQIDESGSNKELYVFRDRDCIIHTPLDSFVLVYDDFFMNAKKKMTMEEFEAFCDEKQFFGIDIFDK